MAAGGRWRTIRVASKAEAQTEQDRPAYGQEATQKPTAGLPPVGQGAATSRTDPGQWVGEETPPDVKSCS